MASRHASTRALAVVLRLFGWLALAGAVVTFVFLITNAGAAWHLWTAYLAGGVLSAALLLIVAEVVPVLCDIEENTRATREHVEAQAKRRALQG